MVKTIIHQLAEISGVDIKLIQLVEMQTILLYSANPDFNYKALIGTLVLRWEFSPGSSVLFCMDP